MNRFCFRRAYTAVSLVVLSLASSAALAETSSKDVSNCLPPVQGVQRNVEQCALTYTKPPRLRQDVLVSECVFLPSEVQDQRLRVLQCSVLNGSEEAIVSFFYSVRYFIDGIRLAEAGFEEAHRFSTGNIEGMLLAGETRTVLFIAPEVPAPALDHQINIAVEVTGVYAHGSQRLLR